MTRVAGETVVGITSTGRPRNAAGIRSSIAFASAGARSVMVLACASWAVRFVPREWRVWAISLHLETQASMT